ncbi:MAG TPA: hypothetical protein VM617_07515 [Thermoanaerobaculia bacterium]|nr:hypothetical protein [Thermoanaerobaculia bacterium]
MSRSCPALLVALLLTAGCAHLPPEARRDDALDLARAALHGGEFVTADQMLSRLAAESPHSAQGHEAQFLLGVLHLDPRNPAWNPTEAEHLLARYLDFPFGERRTEAVVLYALARRLATPQPRILSTGTGTDVGAAIGEAPAADAGTPAGEVERLRRELEARDRELAKLREELERIRRTLTPSG